MTLTLRFQKIINLIKKNHLLHEILNEHIESTINWIENPYFLGKEYKDQILGGPLAVVK